MGNAIASTGSTRSIAASLSSSRSFCKPVTRREILTRMLNNLRQIYFTQRNFRKGLMVLDLLLAIPPRVPTCCASEAGEAEPGSIPWAPRRTWRIT